MRFLSAGLAVVWVPISCSTVSAGVSVFLGRPRLRLSDLGLFIHDDVFLGFLRNIRIADHSDVVFRTFRILCFAGFVVLFLYRGKWCEESGASVAFVKSRKRWLCSTNRYRFRV